MLVGCSNTAYHTMTGHSKQSDIIEYTFQNALEYNADGIISYWQDKTTGKSGHVQPIYASNKPASTPRPIPNFLSI